MSSADNDNEVSRKVKRQRMVFMFRLIRMERIVFEGKCLVVGDFVDRRMVEFSTFRMRHL